MPETVNVLLFSVLYGAVVLVLVQFPKSVKMFDDLRGFEHVVRERKKRINFITKMHEDILKNCTSSKW